MSASKSAGKDRMPDLSGVCAAMIDLDGTMVDTVHDMHAAANLIRAEFSLPPLPVDEVRKYIGKGTGNFVHQALQHDLDPAEVERLLDAAMEHFYRHYADTNAKLSRVFPGVIEGLELFKQKGLRLACVTNKLTRFTEPLMEKMGLLPYFDALYCADSLPRKKPDPLPLITACQRFGLETHQTVVIGDSLNDVLAARAAGCRLLVVPYGYNHGQAVHELNTDGIVETLLEAAQLVSDTSISCFSF